MKALRLKLYQQTACYRKPYAVKVTETYPLPPYATVKGMLHAVLKADTLIPMKISIQGKYEALAVDYQTHYFFKHNKQITTMPLYAHMLYDVKLLLHIHAEEDILRKLEREISQASEYLSLGRWEDLVRVDECSMVELTDYDGAIILPYNAYVPESMLDPSESYAPYKLNWTYEIVDSVRVWKRINVGYVQQGQMLYLTDKVKLDNSTGTDFAFFP